MDHPEAKQVHAAEKYVLGELSEELRDEYEEHYLDCLECAVDVRTAVAFVANSKEVFQEGPQPVRVTPEQKARPTGWSAWLKPLIAIPAMAVLVLTLLYEKRHEHVPVATNNGAEQTLVASTSFELRGGDRKSGQSTDVRLRAGEAFGVHFDFLPTSTFVQYDAQLQDQSGRTLRHFTISGERNFKVVNLVVPGEFATPGKYTLAIYGDAGGAGQTSRTEIATYSFTVDIIP